jgi:hypothetical protein
VAGQRDELGDVHALVAHALDVLDDLQQRGDDAQVAGHRGLQRQQGEHALVDLEIAPVHPVVVGDDELRELDVGVLDRLDRAVDLPQDDVHAAEHGVLELAQLVLEVRPPLA